VRSIIRGAGARCGLLVLLATGGSLALATPALAIQAINVTTTQDGTVAGKTTLRQAIDQANAASGEVEIVLAARGTYTLSQCAPGTDTSNREGPLTYFGSVPVTFEGNGNTLRQTCPGDRILNLQTAELVNINDLTLTGGDAAGQPGGGVWSQGTGELDLKNDVFTNNHSDAAGGGVANGGGKLVITGTTFNTNSGTELAGGIASIGPMELVNSTVTGNTGGTAPGSPANVGGIAASSGLTMIYSTVQDNTAQNINVQQGGLASFGSAVGLSHPTGKTYPDCQINGGTKSYGYNFSADQSCGFGGGPGDRSGGGDPKFEPEFTTTGALEIVPKKGSRLIDVIPKSACAPPAVAALAPVYVNLHFDQVGTRRPQGKGCDIGAIEVPMPTAAFTVKPHGPKAGRTVKFTSTSKELGGRVVSYTWAFGDHSRKAHGRTVKHVFKHRGRYTVTLTVKDAAGNTATKKIRIKVS